MNKQAVKKGAKKVFDKGVDKVEDFLDDGKVNNSNVKGGKPVVGGYNSAIEAGLAYGIDVIDGPNKIGQPKVAVIQDGMVTGALNNPMLKKAHEGYILPIMHELDTVQLPEMQAMLLVLASFMFGGLAIVAVALLYPAKAVPALKLGIFFVILGLLGFPPSIYLAIKIYKNSRLNQVQAMDNAD